MEKLTYRQAFDKITEAYIRGEIKPIDAQFCFCGTLCDNSDKWHLPFKGYERKEHNDFGFYTGKEYFRMEQCIMGLGDSENPHYETALFAGMSAALEVLKEIHRARGEDVDEVPTFTKRELQPLALPLTLKTQI